jgi:hypothetical protein
MRTRLASYALSSALAAATVSTTTSATPITVYAANQQSGKNVNVYISGSTALDNTIGLILADSALGVCQAGTISEYQDRNKVLDSSGKAIGGAAETLWYCQAGPQSGVSTTKYLAIFKESAGGSVNGVQALIAAAKGQASGLVFLNPTGSDIQNGTCANATVGGSDAGCGQQDFQYNVAPTGGLSDLEASLLLTIPGGGSISASDASRYLTAKPLLDTVWGIAVTKNVYYALQKAEHLDDGTVVASCGVPDNDNPACAPSLSREEVSSLFLASEK